MVVVGDVWFFIQMMATCLSGKRSVKICSGRQKKNCSVCFGWQDTIQGNGTSVMVTFGSNAKIAAVIAAQAPIVAMHGVSQP
jgi:hypothetical protein